jgi:hypothetical protein
MTTAPLVVDEPMVESAGEDEPANASPAEGDGPEPSGEDTQLRDDLDRLGVWLRARHNDDLPSPESYATLHDAEAALVQFEADADQMMLRTRALAAMRYAPGPSTRARLLQVVMDPDQHPAARAAATDGLAGAPAGDTEVDAAIAASLRDGDERVRAAAERTAAARDLSADEIDAQ